LSRVAASQGNTKFRCRLEQTVEKFVHPGLGGLAVERQRKKSCPRRPAHSRDVAQPASQTSPSHHLRRMPRPPEKHIFEREIGRDEEFVARRHTQHRAVVADSGDDSCPASGPPLDTVDQRFFACWQTLDYTPRHNHTAAHALSAGELVHSGSQITHLG
jgi:hypothetical protein